MEHSVIDIPHGKQALIDLPVDITAMNFVFKYYDEDLKEERESHIDHWMVDEAETTPKNFKVPAKEFRKLHTAINYARCIYVKYLKSEVRRVKGCDEDM